MTVYKTSVLPLTFFVDTINNTRFLRTQIFLYQESTLSHNSALPVCICAEMALGVMCTFQTRNI